MVFIRYLKHSKGYVMHGEHHNDSMTEVDSYNVEFLKDEFLNIGKIKNDLALFELPLDDQLSLSEEEDLNTHRITEDSIGDEQLLVNQENQLNTEVCPHNPTENVVRPYSHIHEPAVSSLIQDDRSDSRPIEDSIPLKDRGRSSSVGQTSTSPQLRRTKRGRIPR